MNKVLIANRGEIALRIIRTCHEMGIKTVAVYSKADQDSLHVRFAGEAVCIGPAASKDSYLKPDRIIAAAEVTGADAIHPGYGFLAENAEFADICADHDIKFVGPSGRTIRMMGDKSLAKKTMEEAGVPVVPGSEGVVRDAKEGQRIAAEIGYPVMIKASAGGGGRGMRMVHEESAFVRQFNAARSEAEAGFGNPDVYLEKLVVKPRHVEIQVLGDGQGTVIHFGERECSIQRRHQKLVEEAPSPALDEELRAVYRITRACFEGAFLYTAPPEEAFAAHYRALVPRLDPELILLAEQTGEPVGYCLVLPDLLQRARGERVDTAIFKTLAVLPALQGSGLGSHLARAAHERARSRGYRQMIHALMHEANPSGRISTRYGETMRRYAVFARPLG